jgi:four helix bundle protein
MADEPDFAIKFRKPAGPEPETYQLALDFTARVFTVIELAEGVERYYLRDKLDRRSTSVPVLVAQGLGTAVMGDRRTIFRDARVAARDCLAVLDILAHRGTVEPEPLEAARSVARLLVERLDRLTVEPQAVR